MAVGKVYKNYRLNDILSVDWLRRNNVLLEVEDTGRPFRTLLVCRLIKKQLNFGQADAINFLLQVIYGIEKRTYQRWFQQGLDPKKIYTSQQKKFIEGLPKTGEEQFKIYVRQKDKQLTRIGEAIATLDALDSVKLSQSEVKPLINVKRVLEKREAKLAEPEAVVVFESPATMEDVVRNLCEDVATGLMSIHEACDKHSLPYLQFVELVSRSEYCARIYDEAVRLANQLQNSRQLTIVDQKIIALLSQGYYKTETIYFDKHIIPGQLEPVWIEKRKVLVKQDLTPAHLITLKAMLLKATLLASTSSLGDDFEKMTETELLDWLQKNGGEIARVNGELPDSENIG